MAAVLIPAVLYLPSIPFGAGAFGLGDVKLLVGVGLMAGGERALGAASSPGCCSAGVVIVVLLATRRIGRRTYIPFGPFFIIGALWAVADPADRDVLAPGSHRDRDHRASRLVATTGRSLDCRRVSCRPKPVSS